MKIQTPRLLIRQIEMTDDVYIFKAMECPQIHQMHSNGFTDVEKVKSYIEVLLKEYQSDKFRTLAVTEKNTNRLIGLLTLDVTGIFSRAEISYWIDKNYRNKGYATETVIAIIEYCFNCISINRIQAMTSNPASDRLLEKAGMIYEGTLRQYFGLKNSFLDCKMFSILRSDFNPTK